VQTAALKTDFRNLGAGVEGRPSRAKRKKDSITDLTWMDARFRRMFIHGA